MAALKAACRVHFKWPSVVAGEHPHADDCIHKDFIRLWNTALKFVPNNRSSQKHI
jgi:hypothetical protein